MIHEVLAHAPFAPLVAPILLGIVAYLLGCISFGYYLVRLLTGDDIRALGSGNAGARNAGRVLGKGVFLATLAGDALKGAAAIALTVLVHGSPISHALALVAVVAGHIWPVQLRFRGGKGFATAVGALLAFDYRVGLAALAVTVLLYLAVRRGTPAALGATVLSPVLAWLLGAHVPAIIALVAVAIMVLIAHRGYFRGLRVSHPASGPDSGST